MASAGCGSRAREETTTGRKPTSGGIEAQMTRKVARRPPVHMLLACAALACALAALAPAGQAAVKLGPPAVATGRTHVQGASVTLLGSVNPRGAVTTYFFQYGATVAYGKQTTPAGRSPRARRAGPSSA
jgi:hypothetical protein